MGNSNFSCSLSLVLTVDFRFLFLLSCHSQGNPIHSDKDYKLIIIENAEQLSALDHVPVRAYLKQQVATAVKQTKIADIIRAVSYEYMERIEIEQKRADLRLAVLREQER